MSYQSHFPEKEKQQDYVTCTPMEGEIRAECDALAEMLVEKNRKYGNSALSPVRIFSKANTTEQIRVRIDDKLSRMKTAALDEDEDVIQDLLGYLILLRIAEKRQVQEAELLERLSGREFKDLPTQ